MPAPVSLPQPRNLTGMSLVELLTTFKKLRGPAECPRTDYEITPKKRETIQVSHAASLPVTATSLPCAM